MAHLNASTKDVKDALNQNSIGSVAKKLLKETEPLLDLTEDEDYVSNNLQKSDVENHAKNTIKSEILERKTAISKFFDCSGDLDLCSRKFKPKKTLREKLIKTRINSNAKKQTTIRSAFAKNEEIFSELMAQHSILESFNPEDMEVALACSISETKVNSRNSDSSDSIICTSKNVNKVCEKLKQYGVKISDSKDDIQCVLPKFKNRNKWITRITSLTLRCPEKQKRRLQEKIECFLSMQFDKSDDCDELPSNFNISSPYLKTLIPEIDSINFFRKCSYMSSENDSENMFYVTELFEPRKNKLGSLLKNFENIPGRDLSPTRNSLKTSTNLHQRKSIIQNLEHGEQAVLNLENTYNLNDKLSNVKLITASRQHIESTIDKNPTKKFETNDFETAIKYEHSKMNSVSIESINNSYRDGSPDIFDDFEENSENIEFYEKFSSDEVKVSKEALFDKLLDNKPKNEINKIIDLTQDEEPQKEIEYNPIDKLNKVYILDCKNCYLEHKIVKGVNNTHQICGIKYNTAKFNLHNNNNEVTNNSTSFNRKLCVNNRQSKIIPFKHLHNNTEILGDYLESNEQVTKPKTSISINDNVDSKCTEGFSPVFETNYTDDSCYIISDNEISYSPTNSISKRVSNKNFKKINELRCEVSAGQDISSRYFRKTDEMSNNLSYFKINVDNSSHFELLEENLSELSNSNATPKTSLDSLFNQSFKSHFKCHKNMVKVIPDDDIGFSTNELMDRSVTCISKNLRKNYNGNNAPSINTTFKGVRDDFENLNHPFMKENSDDSLNKHGSFICQEIVMKTGFSPGSNSDEYNFSTSDTENESFDLISLKRKYGLQSVKKKRISYKSTRCRKSLSESFLKNKAIASRFLKFKTSETNLYELSSSEQKIRNNSVEILGNHELNEFDEFDRLVYGSPNKINFLNNELPSNFEKLLTAKINNISPIKSTEMEVFQLENDGKIYLIKTKNIPKKPDYNRMSSPTLLENLGNYGLKPLKRKQAVVILEYIYNQTHPIILEKLGTNAELENKIANKHVKVREPKFKHHNLKDLFWEEITNSEVLYDDRNEIYMFQTNISKTISTALLPFHIAWFNLLKSNVKLMESILYFEPIDFEEINFFFKSIGYRYDPKHIKKFLDEKCIIFQYDIQTNNRKRQELKGKKNLSKV